ncbi:single-stranded DNA-binding protein [Paenarthrobacter sp. JL.01a]|uniref:single-stranded DNA-binding protein n=1 Tax=Paenarthrobacter sp. JL.01a TaxID=2979324 RepID=UPI0021C775E8|nr:single-stranded DNA-binding protein [Paenarthrobacter sp. JL.01a]UXM92540.1 single-stranded DNA-binding protein [Paenarthrobacter sp. JL.01a]
MSGETMLTVRGRLTADPELRFTPSGAGVTNFTVAVTAQKFDKNTSEWKDQPTKYWRCAAWNQGKLTRAENIANLLKKGDNVIVYGELTTREYEKDGEKRTAEEIRVETIGKDLTFHGQAYAAGSSEQPPAAEDPWATPPASTGGWPEQSSPPF